MCQIEIFRRLKEIRTMVDNVPATISSRKYALEVIAKIDKLMSDIIGLPIG